MSSKLVRIRSSSPFSKDACLINIRFAPLLLLLLLLLLLNEIGPLKLSCYYSNALSMKILTCSTASSVILSVSSP